MYKEKDERKVGFTIVPVFAVGIIVFHAIIYALPVLAIVKDVAFMAVMVVAVFMLIKKCLTVYEYEISDEKIIIRAILGGRERAVAEASFDGVLCFEIADSEKIKNMNGETRIMCTRKENRYALAVDAETGIVKIIIAPSEKLAEMIKNRMSAEEEVK